jgi:hypothetical protein
MRCSSDKGGGPQRLAGLEATAIVILCTPGCGSARLLKPWWDDIIMPDTAAPGMRQQRGEDVMHCIDDWRRRRKEVRPLPGSCPAIETGAARMTHGSTRP